MSSDTKTFRFSKSGPGRAEVPPERGMSRSDRGLRYKPLGFRSPARVGPKLLKRLDDFNTQSKSVDYAEEKTGTRINMSFLQFRYIRLCAINSKG